MKIFDKIKNFFYDEEEINVSEVKEEKKDKNSSTIISSKEGEKEKVEEKGNNNIEDIVSERELLKSESTFKFPIIFEEDDFSEETTKSRSINVLNIENTKIKSESVTYEEKKVFVPSPIISPIYGIIEQGTKKEVKVSKGESLLNLYEKGETIDIDAIIGRAYSRSEMRQGYKIEDNSPSITKEEETIDLFRNIKNEEEAMEMKRERDIDNKIIKETSMISDEDRLKSIDDLLESTDEQDFYALVDSMYENNEE